MNFGSFFAKVNWFEVVVLILVFFVLLIIINLFTRKVKYLLREKFSTSSLNIFSKFLLYGFVALYIIVFLSFLGFNLSSLLVAGGFISIIIGFATQKVIGNAISGLFLMIERPIKIGQSVEIAGKIGIIEDIRFLSTIIRSFEGPFIRIPNEMVFNSLITNLVENVARRIDYRIGISYQSDAKKATQIIQEVLDSDPKVLAIPEPEIFVDKIGESSIDFIIRFWTPTNVWYSAKNELLLVIREALEANGIEIPFRQIEVKIHNLDSKSI